jgi:hypothetical protein
MLKDGGDFEEGHQDHEEEDIVGGEGEFDEVSGSEEEEGLPAILWIKLFFLGAGDARLKDTEVEEVVLVPEIEGDAKEHGGKDGDGSAEEGFLESDFVGLAVEDEQVNSQHDQNDGEEHSPGDGVM